MKMVVNYFDNEIILTDGKVLCIEIENKKYFYKFIMDLYQISNLEESEFVHFFDDNLNEMNLKGQIRVITNYFDLEFDSKKYSNDICKYIIQNIEDTDKENLMKEYNKLLKKYSNILRKLDLPLHIKDDYNLDNIVKFLKFDIQSKNELLENIFLIIDLEVILKTCNLLFFINLKQYLTKEELDELYKYSLYNQIKIILVDSQCYGVTLGMEQKLIIDSSLEEFMI